MSIFPIGALRRIFSPRAGGSVLISPGSSFSVEPKLLPPVFQGWRVQIGSGVMLGITASEIMKKITPDLPLIKDSPVQLEKISLQEALAGARMSAGTQTVLLNFERHPSLKYFDMALLRITAKAAKGAAQAEFLAGYDVYKHDFYQPEYFWATLHQVLSPSLGIVTVAPQFLPDFFQGLEVQISSYLNLDLTPERLVSALPPDMQLIKDWKTQPALTNLRDIVGAVQMATGPGAKKISLSFESYSDPTVTTRAVFRVITGQQPNKNEFLCGYDLAKKQFFATGEFLSDFNKSTQP